MNEQLMRDCLRMYRDRAAYFEEKWNNTHGVESLKALSSCTAYETAAIMLEYALSDNAELLAQFDYYGEDN